MSLTPVTNRAASGAAASSKAPASVSGHQAPTKPRNQLAMLSLSSALLAGAAGPALAAEVPAPAPVTHQVQHISSTTAVKFPSVRAPQVHASDDGLMTRAASGPVVNYDAPDSYFDQMEGARTAAPLGDVADLNDDVRGLAFRYRDPLIARPQDKTLGSSGFSAAAESAKGDQGADVRGLAGDYRDPAGAIQQDNFVDKVKDVTSALPNSLATVADLNDDVRGLAFRYRDPLIARPQDKSLGSSGSGFSAAAESAKGDQGADVRGLAGDYRDPAGAIQQDNFVDKVKDVTSALPNSIATVADQNADVRGLSKNYRDPAGAIQQDKATDALSSSSSEFGSSAKDAATDLKDKAKAAIKDATSALPNNTATVAADDVPFFRGRKDSFKSEAEKDPNAGAFGDYSTRTPGAMERAKDARKDLKSLSKGVLTLKSSSALPNSTATVADLNADVRNEASGYRDPAIATPQDKVQDKLAGSSLSSPDLSSATEGAQDAADSAAADIKGAASDLKAKAKEALGGLSATPNSTATLADQNADVRGLAQNYRDPAGAIQQDKATDALSSSSSEFGSSAKDAATGLKDKAKAAVKDATSTLPNSLATVADLNADVRGDAYTYRDPAVSTPQDKVTGSSGSGFSAAAESAKGDQGADVRGLAGDYRDPAGAIQQDNFVDKVKDVTSALPNSMATLADQNADVRGLAQNYRDPAGAIQQDKATDALSSSSSEFGSSAKDAATGLKDKAKAAIKDATSALPNSLATVADLNADVRNEASGYRDPAIATPQDKVQDKLEGSSLSSPDLSSATEGAQDTADSAAADIKGAASDLNSKAKDALSGLSATPNSTATLADQNADVRGLAQNYRDPAGAIQQDKATDALSSSSSEFGSSAKDAATDLKDKAKAAIKGRSAMLSTLATVADLNADVRGDAYTYRDPAVSTPQDTVTGSSGSGFSAAAESAKDDQGADVRGLAGDYRDPAGAIQQDNFVDKVKDVTSALPNSTATLADQNADVRGLAQNYRDPAGAIQQDKATDALSSSSSEFGSSAKDAATGLKDKAKAAIKDATSALPNSLATVADLNADVRNEASGYRDPAIATPQDKVQDKLEGSSLSSPDLSFATEGAQDAADSAAADIKGAASDLKAKAKEALSGLSATPNSTATLADQNADVRGLAQNYRDPAGAIQQDKATDALSSSSSEFGSSAKDAATGLKDKAKAAIKGATSALPNDTATVAADDVPFFRGRKDSFKSEAEKDPNAGAFGDYSARTPGAMEKAKDARKDLKSLSKGVLTLKSSSALPNSLATVADQNADVRGLAQNYRDPAGAIQQDKATDALSSSSSEFGSSAKDAATGLKDKAKAAIKDATSALPNSMATVADQNADVRGLAGNYRDPAGAIQQDKATDALSSSSSEFGSSAKDAATGLKVKAKAAVKGATSAVPNTTAIVGDLNRGVRGEASDYRDPAGAIQQDNAADVAKGAVDKAVSSATSATKALPTKGLSTPSVPRAVKKAFTPPSTPKKDIGINASYGPSGTTVNDAAGTKRVSDDVRGSSAPGVGNARLSRPLVRDSLGQLRPASTNQTGAAGGGEARGVKMAKKAADKVADKLPNISAN